MSSEVHPGRVDPEALRRQIREKYRDVAMEPDKGFHFHTGWPLAHMLAYDDAVVASLPQGTVESFAGVGNPFSMGDLKPGETVLDLGCGAGFDSLIASSQVGPSGKVFAVDMTPAMLEKAEQSGRQMGLTNIDFRPGLAEELPIPSESIDVVISNGVINLCPDKRNVMAEINRVLKPGGRVQIADVIVHKELPQEAKDDIDLWSG